eukprot:SAG31_NODE_1069_length_10077_cov_2.403588_2_plen_227_part_00
MCPQVVEAAWENFSRQIVQRQELAFVAHSVAADAGFGEVGILASHEIFGALLDVRSITEGRVAASPPLVDDAVAPALRLATACLRMLAPCCSCADLRCCEVSSDTRSLAAAAVPGPAKLTGSVRKRWTTSDTVKLEDGCARFRKRTPVGTSSWKDKSTTSPLEWPPAACVPSCSRSGEVDKSMHCMRSLQRQPCLRSLISISLSRAPEGVTSALPAQRICVYIIIF